MNTLTDRQREMLILTGQGLTQPELAEHFGVSAVTVARWLFDLRLAFGAVNTMHLVYLCAMQGLLGTPDDADDAGSCCFRREQQEATP